MRLEEYWGVGPKTAALLAERLGADAAIDAIESADGRTLADAGIARGRATQILRRANGGEGMDVLATRDARAVYKELLDLAGGYAVTDAAADRTRVLTPLRDRAAMEARLDDVEAAVETWTGLDEATRADALAAFDAYDDAGGGEAAAVEAALALREAGVADAVIRDAEGGDATGTGAGVFAPLADLDADALADAATALRAMDGGTGTVREGADDRLDRLRADLAAVERMDARVDEVLDAVRDDGVRGTDEFRDAFVDHVTAETEVGVGRVREAMPSDATDATDFVGGTLRGLVADLRESVDEREAEVAADLAAAVEDAREDVDAAVAAVDDIAFRVSLARFAVDFDLERPTIVEGRRTVAVRDARNLALAASDGDVQPVTYAVGDHRLDVEDVPADHRVTVVTGANSGGKTTLLETLCQVSLLAMMGLPVPAAEAEVSVVDDVVFHRRHASFNAGVLEATLRSVVPPLADDGRTLMLVDEFEAITEPGSAADLLHGLVTLTVERDALGAFVTHLADDLEPLPDAARTDGIFAEGLDPDLELRVDYQPRFGVVGKSTPEFIVSRLVADADDRRERAGFETLAAAVGQETVQRTLADARWSG